MKVLLSTVILTLVLCILSTPSYSDNTKGKDKPTVSVPAPLPLALLGLGLIGVATVTRFKK